MQLKIVNGSDLWQSNFESCCSNSMRFIFVRHLLPETVEITKERKPVDGKQSNQVTSAKSRGLAANRKLPNEGHRSLLLFYCPEVCAMNGKHAVLRCEPFVAPGRVCWQRVTERPFLLNKETLVVIKVLFKSEIQQLVFAGREAHEGIRIEDKNRRLMELY